MDIFSSLLSGSVLTLLAVGVAVGLVIRALAALAKDIPGLHIRLDQVQSKLDAQLSGIPAFKETIKEIQETITPQQQQVQKLQDYHNTLLETERKHALAQQDKKASNEIMIYRRGSQ